MNINARHSDELSRKGTKKPCYLQVLKKIKMHMKSIGWAAIIFILSSFPGDQLDKMPLLPIPYFDKWVHLGMYMLFSFLIIHEWKENLNRRKVLAAVFLGVVYGAIMEWMQAYCFIERTGELGDMVSNILGSVLAWPAYKIYSIFSKPT